MGKKENGSIGDAKEDPWLTGTASSNLPPTLSWIKLLALCSVMLGAQFAW